MFIDQVTIKVRAGDGGAGVSSFLRRKGLPKGRPNGGSGGGGGDVYLVADNSIPTLLRYERHPIWKASSGSHGEGELRHGKRGDHLELPVPLGTSVKDSESVTIADLVEQGQRVRIARGGKGGRGNAAFVSPKRKAPTFAEQGEYGEEVDLRLEMKLLADAALVGYPNAGKSTLIARVSSANPKIADYPFTTLTPNLGVVSVGEREFVIADIPGLIEGAAAGKGLGHEFLRHTERARALVVLLDPSTLQDDPPKRQLEVLVAELESHNPRLVEMPRIIALAKSDVLERGDVDAFDLGDDVMVFSGLTGEGIDVLMHKIADVVEDIERDTPAREGFTLHRPLRDDFTIDKKGSEWVVDGIAATRAVNLSDLTDPDAADFVSKRLVNSGIVQGLRDAGAEPGDDVRIGTIVFTFDPETDVSEEFDL